MSHHVCSYIKGDGGQDEKGGVGEERDGRGEERGMTEERREGRQRRGEERGMTEERNRHIIAKCLAILSTSRRAILCFHAHEVASYREIY